MRSIGINSRFIITCIALFAFTSSLWAANITGTVNNKTLDKPSSGDEVVLLKLSEGMQEASRTKTDSQGRFTLPVPEDGGQHLVRVNHKGVNYFKPAPAATASVQVDVYDSAKQVQGVNGRADILRVQADNGQMNVTQLFVLQNDSAPPRTQMSDRSFEFTLPQGAVVDASLAAGPGGMPVNSAPVPVEKNRYAYVFPIRPGETKFQVSYHVPYSGSFSFQPQILTPMQDVVVMLPKSMEFKSGGTDFTAGGEEKGMNIYVAHNVGAGKQLAFSISGTGQIPREAQEGDAGSDGQQAANAQQGAPDNRPGGGLGRPEESPDALQRYKFWILGGLAAALVVGAIVVMNQKPRTTTTARPAAVSMPPMTKPTTAVPASRNILLDAMKEELFQLETERLQGKISDTEYQQAKAALDLTMKRALQRQKT
jgi:hypothetical protein